MTQEQLEKAFDKMSDAEVAETMRLTVEEAAKQGNVEALRAIALHLLGSLIEAEEEIRGRPLR